MENDKNKSPMSGQEISFILQEWLPLIFLCMDETSTTYVHSPSFFV